MSATRHVRWSGARSRGLARHLRFGTPVPGTGAGTHVRGRCCPGSRLPHSVPGCPCSLRAVTASSRAFPRRATFARGRLLGTPVTGAGFCETGRSPGTCQSASVPPPPHPSCCTSALPGGMASGVPPSPRAQPRLPRISLGMPWAEPCQPRRGAGKGCGGCWGSLAHHLAVPQHAVKVRGKDGPPGCCLSTFPARPSVRNGEALSGIRRWLRVIVPLSPPASAPQHCARDAGAAGSPGKAAE